jgi:hypothetical protein
MNHSRHTTSAPPGLVPWIQLAAILILTCCAAFSHADGTRETAEEVSERWRTAVRLRAEEARDQGKVTPLETLAHDMEATLLDAYPDVYAERTVQLTEEVARWPAVQVRAAESGLYGLVLRATEKLTGKVPAWRWGELVVYLADFGHPWEGEPAKDWNERRGTVAKTLVASLRAVREAIDSAWDPDDPAQRPFINVPLPKGVRGASGMSPEAIKDPEQRKLYEAAIAEYDRKREKQRDQMALRRFDRFQGQLIVGYVLQMYEAQPSNPAELESFASEKTLTEAEAARLREAALASGK